MGSSMTRIVKAVIIADRVGQNWLSRERTNDNWPPPFQGRATIAFGARFTYVWYIDEASGPLPAEPSSKGWLYHSHVSSESEINMGLEGFIIVTDPKRARPDGTPNDVDREMAALFMIYDESGFDSEAQEQPAASADSERWVYFQKPVGSGPAARDQRIHLRQLAGVGHERRRARALVSLRPRIEK